MKIPSTIGLPPSTHTSDNLVEASMPVAEFMPCKPATQKGITLFRVTPDKATYEGDLQNYGFELPDNLPLKIAFTAENFPSDQFTNEYGQNFLSKISEVASGGLRDMSQMLGGKNPANALGDLADAFGDTGVPFSNEMSKMAKKAGGAAKSLGKQGLGAIPGVSKEQGSQMIDRMMQGARIDFPQTWKNSGYQPSYNLTVRLYNPNPGNTESTRKYIIGPLAAILLLGLPRTKGLGTFTWPFFHKVHCKGLFTLNPAVITNISVIKGGDQQQIAYNHRPSIVDVRIELVSLYTSMIANERPGRGIKGLEGRPTLKQYLNNMEGSKDVSHAHHASPIAGSVTSNIETTSQNLASQETNKENPSDGTENRVSDEDKKKAKSL